MNKNNILLTSMTDPIPAGINTSKLVCSSIKYRNIIIVLTHLHTTGNKLTIVQILVQQTIFNLFLQILGAVEWQNMEKHEDWWINWLLIWIKYVTKNTYLLSILLKSQYQVLFI